MPYFVEHDSLDFPPSRNMEGAQNTVYYRGDLVEDKDLGGKDNIKRLQEAGALRRATADDVKRRKAIDEKIRRVAEANITPGMAPVDVAGVWRAAREAAENEPPAVDDDEDEGEPQE
jgi:hypothetical protein